MDTDPAVVVAEYEKPDTTVIWLVNPSTVRVAVPSEGVEAAAFATVKVTSMDLVALFASVAVIVAVKVPVAVGVPDIKPEVVLRLRPFGSVPVEA
jgi:hypothetical protein